MFVHVLMFNVKSPEIRFKHLRYFLNMINVRIFFHVQMLNVQSGCVCVVREKMDNATRPPCLVGEELPHHE